MQGKKIKEMEPMKRATVDVTTDVTVHLLIIVQWLAAVKDQTGINNISTRKTLEKSADNQNGVNNGCD